MTTLRSLTDATTTRSLPDGIFGRCGTAQIEPIRESAVRILPRIVPAKSEEQGATRDKYSGAHRDIQGDNIRSVTPARSAQKAARAA